MFSFVSNKEKFFDLFKEAAQNALAGARALKEMFERYENPQESWKKSRIWNTKATESPIAPFGA